MANAFQRYKTKNIICVECVMGVNNTMIMRRLFEHERLSKISIAWQIRFYICRRIRCPTISIISFALHAIYVLCMYMIYVMYEKMRNDGSTTTLSIFHHIQIIIRNGIQTKNEKGKH